MSDALDRHNEDTRAAELAIGEEMSVEQIAEEQQAERERRITECHQVIGRMQGMRMVREFADVSSLVWARDVKASKLYRDIPGIGTWAKFCEALGISHKKMDEDLQNLAAFGEQFLLTVSNFRVGYRDLRKLRQIAKDGTLAVDAEAVLIGDERIPLTPDHAEDLQLALERVIETNAKLLTEKDEELAAKDRVLSDKERLIQDQARTLSKLEIHAKNQGITMEEDAFLAKMDVLRTTFDGLMVQVDPERLAELRDGDQATPRMVAAYLSTIDYLRKQVYAAHSCAVEWYGTPDICPEDGWTPPPLRDASAAGEE